MLSASQHRRCQLFSNATTDAGYGVYGSMTAHGNTGYAGYFINTDTSGNQNYGVYAQSTSTSGQAAQFAATATTGTTIGVYAYTNSTGTIYGVDSVLTGHGNTGYAGYFVNTDTSNSTNYGVYGSVAGTGSSQSAGV